MVSFRESCVSLNLRVSYCRGAVTRLVDVRGGLSGFVDKVTLSVFSDIRVSLV